LVLLRAGFCNGRQRQTGFHFKWQENLTPEVESALGELHIKWMNVVIVQKFLAE